MPFYISVMSVFALIATVSSALVIAGTTITTPLAIAYGNRGQASDSATTGAYQDSPFSLDVQQLAKNKECFEILLENNSDNPKFLICTNNKYYLYNSKDTVSSNKSFEEVQNIQGPNSQKQIIVTLKSENKSQTLTLSDSKWTNFEGKINIHSDCEFVRIDNNQPALTCFNVSTGTKSDTINLTVFNFS